MKRDAYAGIVGLTDALYQAQAAQLQALFAEEQRLRAEISQLESVRCAARDAPNESLLGYREVGADLMWQGFIGRRKSELHSELARLLGRKGQMTVRMRHAFGKHQAACQLSQTETNGRIARRIAKRAGLVDEFALLVARGDRDIE
ncbi:hypothetical protein [uncultured Roseovarius sp.]|uniref:hypothetical protein n=1 Tax=uncultured Roseovarius sp. TaxID=293344 RepID=UPI00260D708D|nr:hypothetical protein [uncultured Roseovarius sp.]